MRLGLAPVAHLHHVVALVDVREVAETSQTVRAQCGLGTPTQQGLTVDVSHMRTFYDPLVLESPLDRFEYFTIKIY